MTIDEKKIEKLEREIEDYRKTMQGVIDTIDIVSKDTVKTLLRYELQMTPLRH